MTTILFLRYMVTSNQLLVITANGIPLWQIFSVPIIISFFLGVVIVALIGPIGSLGLKESNRIEAKLNNTPLDNFIISQSGIFFYEKYQDTNRIIQAKSINQPHKAISGITIFTINSKNELLERIDAPLATLEDGYFQLTNLTIYPSKDWQIRKTMSLPTGLSINSLIQKFKIPELISVWDLPKLIAEINDSGLPVLKYQIYFYKQLFKPITMSAMVLLACWFLSLNNRDNANFKNTIFALIAGLTTYFLLEIVLRALAYGGINPALATLLPILFVILISNFVILHFQEA